MCVCVYLVGAALCVPQGKVRLLLDTVQVLVEAVHQEGQKLLGVLLLVARKLGGEASHLGLNTEGGRGVNQDHGNQEHRK